VIEERVHHNYAFLLGAAISAIGRSIDFPEATRSLITTKRAGVVRQMVVPSSLAEAPRLFRWGLQADSGKWETCSLNTLVRIASLPPIPFPGPGHVETLSKKLGNPHLRSEKMKKKASKTRLFGLSNSEGLRKSK
jgi:hypothetical protein